MGVRDAGGGEKREEDAEHCEEAVGAVAPQEVEEAGGFPKGYQPHEGEGGHQAPVAAQRAELVQGDQEGHQVDEAHPSLEEQADEPVTGVVIHGGPP